MSARRLDLRCSAHPVFHEPRARNLSIIVVVVPVILPVILPVSLERHLERHPERHPERHRQRNYRGLGLFGRPIADFPMKGGRRLRAPASTALPA
jgi:hypothetical protein